MGLLGLGVDDGGDVEGLGKGDHGGRLLGGERRQGGLGVYEAGLGGLEANDGMWRVRGMYMLRYCCVKMNCFEEQNKRVSHLV